MTYTRNNTKSSFRQRHFRNSSRGRSNTITRNRRRSQYIDPALFVKKAISQEKEIYTPTHSFSDFAISEQIKKNVEARGYKTPTPIQDQAIPHILLGKDVVGMANTGTGKTAAFLIPLIHKVSQNPSQKVLIVAPTLEIMVLQRGMLFLEISQRRISPQK